VGPSAGLDRCGKSRPHRDSIPDHPARSSVAIPTELPAHEEHISFINNSYINKNNLKLTEHWFQNGRAVRSVKNVMDI